MFVSIGCWRYLLDDVPVKSTADDDASLVLLEDDILVEVSTDSVEEVTFEDLPNPDF